MSRNRIAVVGSSNTDLVLNCARLPRAGETVLGGAFERFAGGKGANQAVAAARAGEAKVSFVGARGDDEFGRSAYAGLKAEGIDVRRFSVKPEYSSGVALILIGGQEKENIIGVARSANDALGAADVRAALDELQTAVVVAQLEIPLEAVQQAANWARERGGLFILNPAPARKLPLQLLKRVGVLTPNQSEAELLTGQSDPSRAARILCERGVARVAITLGARGVLSFDGREENFFKAPKVRPVDTVGAGDCFNGFLASFMASGSSFENSVMHATAAASLAVTKKGAQAGMPSREEFDAFSKKFNFEKSQRGAKTGAKV